MKREMSAFDVLTVVGEMQSLVGGFVDKFFQWDRNVLIRVNVPGESKREVYFKGLKFLYMADERPDIPMTPTSFAVNVRKHITNARIVAVRQHEFDRIVVMELEKAQNYQLVFELFGGGNFLLVSDGRIVNSVLSKVWRHRQVRPGADHQFPPSRFNPLNAAANEFRETLVGSSSDVVRTLATSVNMGGQYGEEVSLRAGVDKKADASGLDADQVVRLQSAFQEVLEAMGSPDPVTVLEGDQAVDATPIPLVQHQGKEMVHHPTLSAAVAHWVSTQKEREEEDRPDPESERLNRLLQRQLEAVEAARLEADDVRASADAIYEEYAKVQELLTVLEQQSQRLTWDKLREGAMRIDFVEDIDPSKSMVLARVSDRKVWLDYTQGIDANANRLYQKSKDLREKSDRAEVAMVHTEERLQRRLKGVEKARVEAKGKAKPTKAFWFESYKWFFTTGGKLVLAGRDARSNDKLVKRHLKPEDRYAHADVHGAPSVVIKEGSAASDDEMREVCQFALARSKAWTAGVAEGSAYWVLPDQVTKTPQAGEFVPRGAFIIRGKRNYEYHLPLEMAVGEIQHQGERKIMCAPVDTMAHSSTKYAVIRPIREKNRNPIELARAFDVPEEEISRILPPGNIQIVRRVGFEE